MKKLVVCLLALLFALLFTGCGEKKKIVHCDRCGREVEFPADSNVTEDWIILCSECKD